MNPSQFALTIVSIVILFWLFNLVISCLSISSSKRALPVEVADIYEEKEYLQSQKYHREQNYFELWQSTFMLVIFLVFWWFKGFLYVDNLVSDYITTTPIFKEISYLLVIVGLQVVIKLPFSYYHNFVIEAKYGFNKMTRKLFIQDTIKSLIIGAVFLSILLAGIFWLFQHVAFAWFWGWLFFLIVQLGMMYLFPTYIMPLFNKFTPLADGELKQAIAAMAAKTKFALQEIYTIDGSKRSAKANAFFTGFGKNKKIALYDTLIEQQTTPELVAILAHEVGHFKCKHLLKMLLWNAFTLFFLFLLLGKAMQLNSEFAQNLQQAFYISEPQMAAGMIFFMILYTPLSKIFSLVSSAFSRKHEFEADYYAAVNQGTGEHLITALKKLAKHNYSNLTPHWLEVLEHSHPPVLKRIQCLQQVTSRQEKLPMT